MKKIVFFGDSVTEGCFEIVRINGVLEVVKDITSCYVTILSDKIDDYAGKGVYEYVNAGISGNSLDDGIKRIEKDVLSLKPYLVVICFGLNDISKRNARDFGKKLAKTFGLLKDASIKTVFMTPNCLNEYVSPLCHKELYHMAEDHAACQNGGVVDEYVAEMKRQCEEYGVVCVDAYEKWKKLKKYGIDTTSLLCNHINHPKREMHGLFADLLFCALKTNRII